MNPWPYSKDGYCLHCGIAQYKPHKPSCYVLGLLLADGKIPTAVMPPLKDTNG